MGSFQKAFVCLSQALPISRQSLGTANPWSQAIEHDFLLLQEKVLSAR